MIKLECKYFQIQKFYCGIGYTSRFKVHTDVNHNVRQTVNVPTYRFIALNVRDKIRKQVAKQGQEID